MIFKSKKEVQKIASREIGALAISLEVLMRKELKENLDELTKIINGHIDVFNEQFKDTKQRYDEEITRQEKHREIVAQERKENIELQRAHAKQVEGFLGTLVGILGAKK